MVLTAIMTVLITALIIRIRALKGYKWVTRTVRIV